MLAVRPFITGPAMVNYQNTGQCSLNIIYNLSRFSHEVVDRDGFSLRRFYSYQAARDFIYNKPDYKVSKIKFDISQFKEALF